MDALSVAENPPSLETTRVGVVTIVTTATTQAVVEELRRSAVRIELLTVEIVHAAPTCTVYIVSLDRAVSRVFADKLVEWSQRSDPQPGLIGIVEGGSSSDTEALLSAGFDDALATPVSSRELAGRVRALHRRVLRKTAATGRLRYGGLTIDLYARTLWANGKAIALTSIELAVLRELIKARGRPLSRSELLDGAWGQGELEVSERAVDNVILRLRRKLPKPELIMTVRSVGFRLASE